MVDFGEKVRALREARGLSQVQFAELLGVTKGMISAYETSVRMPSYKVLIRIARLFGVSTDYLLGLECKEGMDTSGLNARQKQLVAELVNELRRTKLKRGLCPRFFVFGLRLLNAQRDAFAVYLPVLHIAG